MATVARYVKLTKFEELTGYTPKAVHRKKEEGVWLMGRELIKAEDGNLLVDREGYDAWGERARQAA